MNFLDNGDGTYTDADTGDLYDSFGSIINAVPNQSPLDYQNTTAVTSSGQVDTAAGPVNTNGGAGTPILSGIDAFINGVESVFTDLYQPLVSAGVVQTPAQKAAAAAAAATANTTAAQVSASSTTQRYLVLGVVALVLIYALKS